MKTITIALLLCAMVFQTYATHLRGGYISARNVTGHTYEITVYLETTDIEFPPDRDTVYVDCGDGSGINILRINGPAGTSGVPMGDSTFNNSKLNIYRGEHTYAADGDYIISYANGNRVAGINNATSSVNTFMYIETLLRVNPYCRNTTAVFAGNETLISFVNNKINLSFNAYDPNRDSLSYEIIPSLRAHNLELSGWVNPADIGGVPGTIFSIDNKSGMLTWDKPSVIGLYNFAIKVSEWKKGCLYGYTIRDVQIYIDANTFNYGNFIGLENLDTNALGEPEIHVNGGDTLRFSFAYVNEGALMPDITVMGEPFDSNYNATYSYYVDSSLVNDSLVVTVEWITPAAPYTINQPYYYITIRGISQTNIAVSTVHIFNDVIIPVYLHSSAPITNCSCLPPMTAVDEQILQTDFTVYPNPADNHLQIITNLNGIDDVQYQIVNTLGGIVSAGNATAAAFSIDVSALPGGIYFIRLQSGNAAAVKRFVKN